MPIDPEIRKFRIDRVVEAFQWSPQIWHPLIHELEGRKFVVDTRGDKHFLRGGDWVVYDPVYRTACVVDPSYFPQMFSAVEIRPMKSMRAGMTDREWKRMQRDAESVSKEG